MNKPLVIAILAKTKGHLMPLYLDSILSQTEVSSSTIFYIRTNDNADNTAEVLRDFYKKWSWKYKMVFDDSSINPELVTKGVRDWDYMRFKILGEIRQKSIEFAISENADYFVADVDNIILPHTIKSIRSVNLPVVAPLLYNDENHTMYSNFHSSIDPNGYYQDDDVYTNILYRKIKGLIELPVIHCTYLIKNDVLRHVNYDDLSGRYEYVIFSDSLRKAGIPQYLDNREVYGRLFWSIDSTGLSEESKIPGFANLIDQIPMLGMR